MQAVIARVAGQVRPSWRGDPWLAGIVTALLAFSVVMVFSVTVVDDDTAGASFDRILRHVVYIGIGVAAMLAAALLPTAFWQRLARPLMVAGVVLLALVLVPGIGVEVNGSQRWIALGPLRVQPSELMKLAMIVYMADYLTRRRAQLRSFRLGVVNVCLVVALVAVLLLLEPDLGTTVVLAATVFAMMYLSGVRYLHMALCVAAAAAAFAVLVYVSPYRLERVLSFQNPWADPFDSGFQLSQALIAFGRGEWFGAGLGQSIQKLYYLPHAANDFLAAVIAEELGLAGIVALIALYIAFTWRGFAIAAAAERAGHHFAARLVHGATFLVALQAIVNLGVNMGVLPTKGLTLPLMSYGGSSMIVTLCMAGMIFGVDRQLRAPAAGRRAR